MSTANAPDKPTLNYGLDVIPFTLAYPGSKLCLQSSQPITLQLELIEQSLLEAAISLGLFRFTLKNHRSRSSGGATAAMKRSAFHYEIVRRIETTEGRIALSDYGSADEIEALNRFKVDPNNPPSTDQLPEPLKRYDAAQTARDRMVDTEVINNFIGLGYLPLTYELRMGFLHARNFVHALHMTQRALMACADPKVTGNDSLRFVDSRDKYIDAFRGLNDIRNSLAHMDERILEAARRNQRPVNDVRDELFTEITRSGKVEGLLIEESTFIQAVGIIQALLDSLPWEGHPKVIPTLHMQDFKYLPDSYDPDSQATPRP